MLKCRLLTVDLNFILIFAFERDFSKLLKGVVILYGLVLWRVVICMRFHFLFILMLLKDNM